MTRKTLWIGLTALVVALVAAVLLARDLLADPLAFRFGAALVARGIAVLELDDWSLVGGFTDGRGLLAALHDGVGDHGREHHRALDDQGDLAWGEERWVW